MWPFIQIILEGRDKRDKNDTLESQDLGWNYPLLKLIVLIIVYIYILKSMLYEPFKIKVTRTAQVTS